MENNCDLTIEALAPLIRRRKLSPVELTRYLLERISRLQPEINAYLTITADAALAQAGQAEKEISRGHYRGVLHGIPISLKDLFYTRGIRTTAGSKILKRFVPKENAAIVNRLLECGCVFLGKTNLHEFAFGATNVNPHYGPVRNPWDTGRISGGSSGGSAASVVSAQALASFGTDTGGSIRIPSAACGCVGLKPTYGRVPMSGIIPLAGSLDHAGPLSRCVMDAAFLLNAVAEPRLWNAGTARAASEIRRGVKSFRIGIPRQYFFDHIRTDVRKAVLASIGIFEQLGAKITELNLTGMEETAALAAEITGDEAFAYHEKWLKRRPQDYGKDVRLRLEQSSKATAALYIGAQQKRLAYSERLRRCPEQSRRTVNPNSSHYGSGHRAERNSNRECSRRYTHGTAAPDSPGKPFRFAGDLHPLRILIRRTPDRITIDWPAFRRNHASSRRLCLRAGNALAPRLSVR